MFSKKESNGTQRGRYRGGERETERQKERERQTDREREGERDRDGATERDRETERERQRERERERERARARELWLRPCPFPSSGACGSQGPRPEKMRT